MRKLLNLRIIGPTMAIIVLASNDPTRIWAVLVRADIGIFAVAIALAVPLSLVKGVRWQALLKAFNIDVTLAEAMDMYNKGMTVGALSPGRVGDFVKVYALVKSGYRVSLAVASNIVDRLLDLAFLGVGGLLALWFFSGRLSARIIVAGPVTIVVLLVLLGALGRRRVIEYVDSRPGLARLGSGISGCWMEIGRAMVGARRRVMLALCGLTIGFWVLHCLAQYLCSLALGLPVPILYFAACLAISTVASFLPISIGGVGTRDGVFMVLLGQVGFSRQESLALATLILAVFLCNCITFYLISVMFERRPTARGCDRIDTGR